MNNFATIDDLTTLWRPLDASEQEKANELLRVVSNSLRFGAVRVGKDLDEMVAASEAYADVVRSVTVDVVARNLMTSTDTEPMTQFSQTAGPFTASGTFLVPGGGLFIKNSEWERLGLRRQRMGMVSFYAAD